MTLFDRRDPNYWVKNQKVLVLELKILEMEGKSQFQNEVFREWQEYSSLIWFSKMALKIFFYHLYFVFCFWNVSLIKSLLGPCALSKSQRVTMWFFLFCVSSCLSWINDWMSENPKSKCSPRFNSSGFDRKAYTVKNCPCKWLGL